MKEQEPTSVDPHWWQWWHESKEFKIEAGFDEPVQELELWYDIFWKPYRVSAWAYELVRRLQLCPKVALSPDGRALLQKMPPYPKLDLDQKDCLRHTIARAFQRPLVLLNEGSTLPFDPAYSDPIKPWSFDLRAGNKELKQFFWSWIEQERQRLGIERKQGPKGASRNPDQSYKRGNWRHVELLERPYREVQGRELQRKEIIATAKQYVIPVVDAWHLAELILRGCLPPVMYCPAFPSLNGRDFSREQLVAVIRRVMEKSAKTAG